MRKVYTLFRVMPPSPVSTHTYKEKILAIDCSWAHCLGGPPVSILPHVKLGPSLCHPPGKESCEGLLNLCEFSLSLSTPLPGILLSLPAQQWGHRHTLPHLAFLSMCQGSELRLSYVCTQQAPSTQLDPHQPRPPFPHGVTSFPLQICSDPGLTPSYLRDDEQIRVNSIFPLFQENNMSTTKAPINQ